MAYAPNYYNYQVAVIFAIMLGGMLLLAALVGAIYFICVTNMRNKKTLVKTPSGGRPMAWQPSAVQPPYSSLHSPPPQPQQQSMQAEYDARVRASQSPYNAAYTSQPLVQPYSQQEGARIRELPVDYAYQQGPMTWTTMSPVGREDHIGPPSGSQQLPITTATAGYHMSSV
ncbi:hypothetical protein Ddc_08023 [Ditylenchus destructor]|nr:hypothetical protein Ddc_08023 [Ditylenchus destructor]